MAWPEYQYGSQRPVDVVTPTSYRGDREWDDYGRQRQWDDYDRGDRRDSTRGRSRSPGPDDAGRKRRRSPSPYDRGRYEPRPRYGDDRDSHRYRDASPRRSGHHPHGYGGRSGRPPPPNPYEQDHPAQLRQFADWFRYTHPQQAAEEERLDADAAREAGADVAKPRDGIRIRWEKYKKTFTTSQVWTMYEHHKKSPWFAEKYDPSPEFTNLRNRVRKEGWRGRLANFLLELEEGKHDPEIAPAASDDAPPKDPVPAQTETLKAEPSNGDADVKPNLDEDAPYGMDAEEDNHENENKEETNGKAQNENKKPMRSDEVSVLPEGNEVMIRTIPPDIGRVKLEDACSTVAGFVHLALGDPLQKRNFYRAGWIKFQDDADMERAIAELGEKKLDGFKLHVTNSTRPFVSKLRTTPEVASRPARIEKDLAQVKQLVAILEAESAKLRRFAPPKSALPTSKDAKEPNGVKKEEADGDRPEEVKEEDIDLADESQIEPDPPETGSEAIERRVEKIVSELQEHQTPAELDSGVGFDTKKAAIALDLYVAYVRSAFNACYYCAAITDHVEELQRKCVKHVRKPLSEKAVEEIAAAREKAKQQGEDVEMAQEVKSDDAKPEEQAGDGEEATQEKDKEQVKEKEKENKDKSAENREWKRNDERWIDWLDQKVALLINRDGVDPRDYGGKNYDEELSKAVEPHIKQEDEGKYRCRSCNKLFKATAFVEKHVANKHPELVRQLEELPYFNNFALDPHRIQAFSYPPPPVGNSIAPPPQAYGLKNAVWPEPPRAAFPHHPFPPPVYGYPPPYMDWQYQPYPPPLYGPGYGPEPPMAAGRGPRLSDRVGGYADGPAGGIDGLPAKPMAGVDSGPPVRNRGPPLPPPPDAKEDPRAAGGRKISYHDIDRAAAGDDVNIELSY
ncbi:hypothetical protein SISSUDRAFT_1025265 [Sistotremastrum suecicum HHB10207 ss-3]|uniref:C2H2-type domain-containing protein n=1 Tax=Sistotremastrum suecicum HHB10207 ss-3 TaxID=1314776 RepID=A0A166AP40_9AGAM|nr:hypothetical protein SISSUDRAFT_1025265 [Sistotremastrum suecicum HHB10207 ss-3]